MTSAVDYRNVVAQHGMSLPEGYVALLDGRDPPVFCHPATGGCQWRMLSLSSNSDGLLDPVQVGELSIMCWELPKGHAAILDEVGIEILNGPEQLPVDRFRRGVAFAKCEGDHLFLLPDGSVWCFWHDGHEALRLAGTWREWIQQSTGKEELSDSPSAEPGIALVGRWKPVSSKTENPERFVLLFDVLEFLKNNDGVKNYPDGTSSSFRWEADEKRIFMYKPERVEYKYQIEGNTLDLALKDGSFHCLYERLP